MRFVRMFVLHAPRPLALGGRWFEMVALSALLVLGFAPPAHAFRPFDGTDADVENARHLNVEFGPLRYIRVGSERSLVCPELSLTYGVGSGIEVGAEAARLLLLSPDPEGVRPSFEDIELTAKKLIRSGSLQEKKGVSLATEGVLLLPTTSEHKLGVGIGVIAGLESTGV